jgi:hypothetical protein
MNYYLLFKGKGQEKRRQKPPFLVFSVARYFLPRKPFIRPPLETVRRLHLRFLLLRPSPPNPNGFHIAELSTNLLVALSNLCQAPQKDSSICLVLQNN